MLVKLADRFMEEVEFFLKPQKKTVPGMIGVVVSCPDPGKRSQTNSIIIKGFID